MNDMQPSNTSIVSDEENNVSFIDLLIALAKHKKLIFFFPILLAICGALFSLTLPNIYKADSSILPPQQAQTGASAFLSQLGGSAGIAAPGFKNPNDLYIGMLKSRIIADNLIHQFGLTKVYGGNSFDVARQYLASKTNIMSRKDGLISIEVEDVDPKRAAQIANAYSDELLKLTKVMAITEASQRRLFLARQLELAKDKLALAENALKSALDTRGVINVDSESMAIVSTVANLRTQIVAKEIQLNAMQSFVTVENQAYKRNQQELASMKNALAKLENGKPLVEGSPGQAGKQMGLENMKVLRDVKHYQMLYELLAKQYEIARLDESKDASIVQVLDKAIEPEKRIKPKRSVITLSCGFFGLFLAIFWAIFMETMQSAKSEFKKKLKELKSLLGFRVIN